ncbi:MAG TPA: flagellar M-ring protein FliF, partial [Nitrospirae bacterium]|nr:flagellar M-ring protein FliF [Nitrospirota bacterium]
MAFKNLMERIQALDFKKRIILLTLMVISIASVILLIVWAQAPSYQVLYSNLQQEDAGLIIQKLREMKIPYKTTATGIMVPA